MLPDCRDLPRVPGPDLKREKAIEKGDLEHAKEKIYRRSDHPLLEGSAGDPPPRPGISQPTRLDQSIALTPESVIRLTPVVERCSGERVNRQAIKSLFEYF